MADNMTKWFSMQIKRAKGGTIFTVQTDPRVEEFFKANGDGRAVPVEIYGRGWQAIDAPLAAYNVADDFLDIRIRERYTISQVSGDMHIEGDYTNLSFLRLVGIGSPEGVSFLVASPMSIQKLASLKASILEGVRSILYEYVVPAHITLELLSKEL